MTILYHTKVCAMPDRTCPPCNGQCRQGRDCPANLEHDDENPLALFIGLRNALGIMLALFIIGAVFACVFGGGR